MSSPTNTPLAIRSDLDFTGLRFKMRSSTKGITLHCAASKPNQNWGAVEVDRMHRAQGWLCIGYHFIINRDGVIFAGRPMDVQGAHCKAGGRNSTHVSVCMAGGVSAKPVKHVPGSPWNGSDAECNFTKAQFKSLDALTAHLKETYGLSDGDIEGHRDVPGVRKACPSFNVAKYVKTGVAALD